MNKLTRPIVFLVVALLSLGAMAQWQWLDKDGHKVFSDRAPPAGVPEKNILKRPGSLKSAAIVVNSDVGDAPSGAASAATSGSALTPASAPKLSGVDKELAEKKKKADQAEAAKRKTEEDRISKAKAENCERAKQAKSSLESGMRIGQVNKQGEREIMDDAARAAEGKRIQSVIDSDCK
jgi:hypothetical protein